MLTVPAPLVRARYELREVVPGGLAAAVRAALPLDGPRWPSRPACGRHPRRERAMSAPAEPRPSDSRDHRSGHLREPRDVAAAPGRRGGYAGSLLVSLIMLVLVNVWPGWEAVPFLTGRTVLVIGAVNASIIARAVADLVNIVLDLPRARALGDIVSIGFGLAAIVQVWQVFPLDVIGTAWEVVARVLLAIGFVGSGIGILEAFVRLVRGRFPRM